MSGSQRFARLQFDRARAAMDKPKDHIRMPDSTSNAKRRSGFRVSPIALMRLSALLFLFLMLGHVSAYPWSSAKSVQETHLVASMKSIDFTFMGERSTYWGLYFGWGLLVALLLITMAAMLWLLSDLARLAPRRLGLVAAIVSAACGGGAYLSFRYFYVPPALFLLANGAILLIAAVQLLGARAELAPEKLARP